MNSTIKPQTNKDLKITLVRSISGRLPKHRATLSAMGLRRLGQSVYLPNNQSTIGMIRLVHYVLKVEGEITL